MEDPNRLSESIPDNTMSELCDGSIEGCNGGDEFITSPCPIHSKSVLNEENKQFGSQVLTITDANLASPNQQSFTGFVFNCPACELPSVMVNPHMGKVCCNCGQRVMVKSKMITKLIRMRGGK